MRAPGVWPVVDQNVTKYAAPQRMSATAPTAASAVSIFDGTWRRFSASATIAATPAATRSMISASMPNAMARVTRPV